MSDTKPHEVGYMKPPKRSQFRKGQSGNPNGRPRKIEDPYSVLKKVLARKLKLTIAGQERKMPIREALMRRLRERALAGERRAIALQQKILEQAVAASPDHGPAFDFAERKRQLAERLGLMSPAEEEEPIDGR